MPGPSKVEPEPDAAPTISVDDLAAASGYVGGYNGEKFPGGLGGSNAYDAFLNPYAPGGANVVDYWQLRAWSNRLFTENLYARGLIRRLITNEINTGMSLEATPVELITGMSEEGARTWTDDVEARFMLWGKSRRSDYAHLKDFGGLQRAARATALISGDVLIIPRRDRRSGLPKVQLIPGEWVRTPVDYKDRKRSNGNRVVHGIEIDKRGRHVAFWITQDPGQPDGDVTKMRRLPARGEKSRRKLAWLLYGTDKRLDEVRGQPLLSLVTQSLKEADRMRDAEQRAAALNAMLAMIVKKDEDKPGTLPITGGAVRKDQVTVADGLGGSRVLTLDAQLPGLILDELQTGETPESFNTQRPNVNFGAFEASILSAIAWANEIPPEILFLAFQNNFSASRAAQSEFKLYLNKARAEFCEGFCIPVYNDWLISSVFNGDVRAPGLLEAWRDPRKQHIYEAWINADWGGAIKLSVDLGKEVNAYIEMVKWGFCTPDRAARELTGTKWDANVARAAPQFKRLAEAFAPMAELENPTPEPAEGGGGKKDPNVDPDR